MLWSHKILYLSDGMLHEMVKALANNRNKLQDADPITDKVLNHTHKKKNKRYKIRKKKSREAK